MGGGDYFRMKVEAAEYGVITYKQSCCINGRSKQLGPKTVVANSELVTIINFLENNQLNINLPKAQGSANAGAMVFQYNGKYYLIQEDLKTVYPIRKNQVTVSGPIPDIGIYIDHAKI